MCSSATNPHPISPTRTFAIAALPADFAGDAHTDATHKKAPDKTRGIPQMTP
jgi:hypothetical protein